jgi:Family of unknown function (DUF6328)
MSNEGGQGEAQHERVNRELVELLQELRVALPGVQVMFAFLLTVPFSQGFVKTTTFQRDLFFATLAATAISTALLIAPSAWHRIHFRQKDKENVLIASNKLSISGLAFLALAMIGAVTLIADFVFSGTLAVIAGLVATVLLGLFWAAIPLIRHPGRPRT